MTHSFPTRRSSDLAAVGNFIDVNADSRTHIDTSRDTAHRNLGIAGARRLENEPRDGVGEVAKLRCGELGEIVPSESSHALRNVFQQLFAMRRGADDLGFIQGGGPRFLGPWEERRVESEGVSPGRSRWSALV